MMQLNLDFTNFKQVIGSAGEFLPADFPLRQLSSLENAGENDVVVVIDRGDASVFDAVANRKIALTKAACVLASSDILPGRTCVVADALDAYQKLVNFVAARDCKPFVRDERYPLAFISSDAHLEQDVQVEPGVVVMPGARIGAGCQLLGHAYIGADAVIGQRVTLHPGVKVLDRCLVGDYSILHAGAVVGADGFGYQVTQRGLRKIPQIGIVRIGKHVELGANAVIDRATFDETVIDDGAKLDNFVSIAHNVVVGKSSAILAQSCVGGSTRIGLGCLIGAQVAIKDNITIGNRVKIVSMSGIMDNLEDGKTVAGIPAIPFTEWKRIQVITRQLPTLVRSVQKMMQPSSWWGVVVKKMAVLMGR